MDATQDILHSKWQLLKVQVQQRWGKLTDDDVNQMTGKFEELTSLLRKRYGYGKAQAEIEIKSWLGEREQGH